MTKCIWTIQASKLYHCILLMHSFVLFSHFSGYIFQQSNKKYYWEVEAQKVKCSKNKYGVMYLRLKTNSKNGGFIHLTGIFIKHPLGSGWAPTTKILFKSLHV